MIACFVALYVTQFVMRMKKLGSYSLYSNKFVEMRTETRFDKSRHMLREYTNKKKRRSHRLEIQCCRRASAGATEPNDAENWTWPRCWCRRTSTSPTPSSRSRWGRASPPPPSGYIRLSGLP